MRLGVSILIAAGLGFASSAAEAETAKTCAAHETVQQQLGAKYQEKPVAGGLTSEGHLLQVYAALDGQTWTIVLSKPDGSSCLTLAGEAWRDTRPKHSAKADGAPI